MLHELHHAVLHNVQRRLIVPNVIKGPLERAALHTFKKVRELLWSGQDAFFS
jgi:hypothetical protein